MSAPPDAIMPHPVYTIGHSNLSFDAFVAALRRHGVAQVADVRSRPQSFHHPQFSQPEFEINLRAAGIGYVSLGEELGGRPDDEKAYAPDGRVDYRARRRARGFQAGIERVLTEAERQPLALLCAEEDPITCHRFLLVGPALLAAGVVPQHIRKGGSLESQQDAEDRMLREHHFDDVSSSSLFAAGRAAALEDAYDLQARECAFRAEPQAADF